MKLTKLANFVCKNTIRTHFCIDIKELDDIFSCFKQKCYFCILVIT